MRVISGTAKGRPLKAVPGTGTRPTTDKVKEAIFSMIGPYFDGGWALDLFAGTGGLGIEALSRGAERAVFVDLEKKSVDVVNENVRAAGMTDRSEVYRNDASRAIKALAKRSARFRLVFLDPPYRLKTAGDLLLAMQEHDMLEPDATIVVEHDSGFRYPDEIGGCRSGKHAEYGDTAVTVYRYSPDEERETERITSANEST